MPPPNPILGGSLAAPDDKQVNDEIARLRKLTSQLQSERDKMKHELERCGNRNQGNQSQGSGQPSYGNNQQQCDGKSWWDGRQKNQSKRKR